MKNLFNTRSWFVTLLPAGLIIFLGVVQFKNAVLQTVQLSPHPQIIYLIAGGFVAGLITISLALQHCLSEREFLLSWSRKNTTEAAEMLRKFNTPRSVSPLLTVLDSIHTRAPQTQQEIIEKEVDEFDKALHQGLNFPAYISSALIGLGLVGTFIGLLGSLQEMADIISSMMNSSSGGQSPFSEMLRKLKRPMEGMGTAFVASMYGLMGSLLLEWMLVSVRKVCTQVLLNTRQVIREREIANDSASASASRQIAPHVVGGVTTDQFMSISGDLQTNQLILTRMLEKHEENEQIRLKAQDEYVSAVANRKSMDRNTQELLLALLKVNQQTLQAQEANKQQAQEFSRLLATQFEQLSARTQQLNTQVTELNKIYQDALNKPSLFKRVWTGIKASFSVSTKPVNKKKR